ncbi:quinolinate phosphoribosyl transferase [Candidatus Desantisbacteria bacterium]|nr:quinolinate phosphoribosyl transferase [Candidatus Desantisbacteria bacterium]
MKERLPPAIFDLPVHELRRGYRSDVYFWREKIILEKDNHYPKVIMQVFQKEDAILCGIDEAIAILKVAAGYYTDPVKGYKLFDQLIDIKKEIRLNSLNSENYNKYLELIKIKLDIQNELDNLWISSFNELKVKALYDGEKIKSFENVMTVEGIAGYFAHLETVYLGVLARRTRIATNVYNTVRAAGVKPVLFFPARFDHFSTQGGDGYAAKMGGTTSVSTDSQAEWWGAKGIGTIPHSLIAVYNGNTVLATKKFAEIYPELNLISLVDYENDCVKVSLEVAKELGKRLYGVRLDTSGTMVDKSVIPQMGQFPPTGVTPQLVCNVRNALDEHGFGWVKIIVSGGFNPEKIRFFEEEKIPVDAYGVGSYLFAGAGGKFDFTADIVINNNKHCAKEGRRYRENERLEVVI